MDISKDYMELRDAGEGNGRQQAPLLRGQGGQKCPSLTVFILILATVFQPKNKTEGSL